MKQQRWIGLIIGAAALLAAAGSQAHAQERRMPGAVVVFEAGYDYGFAVPANSLQNYTDLTSDVKMESAGISLILPKLFGNGFGLSTTWSYGISDIHMNAQGDAQFYNDRSGEYERALVNQQFDAHFRTIQADIMAYIQAGDVVRLEIGPHASVGFLPGYDISESILSPDTITYSDGQRYWEQHSTSDPNVVVGTAGLGVRASLEIPLSIGLALVPSAQVRGSIVYTNVPVNHYGFARDAVGVTGTAGVGLGVIFGSSNGELIPAPPPLPSAPPTIIIPPPAPLGRSEPPSDTLTVPVPPALHARVELFCQDPSGRRSDTFLLSPRRTLHRMHVPLVPVLYFEPNSAALPERYAGYTPETRGAFTLSALAGANIADLYRQGLNIIGMRMADDPAATIAITGSTAPGEAKRFAAARAETVRNYLNGTWGIERSRMRLMPVASGRGSGDRIVAIASESRTVTAPIVTEWIEESVDAPPVVLEPAITAAAGVRSWRATVMHNGRQIGVLRSNGTDADGSIDAGLVLRDFNQSGRPSALDAELIVEDSTGALAMARDTLPVLVDSVGAVTGELVAERTVSQHVLPVASVEETDRSINAIVAGINGSATIEVAPYVWGPSPSDQASIDQRLGYVGSHLRDACEQGGKHITAFDVRSESVALDGADRSLRAPQQLISPIQVTVIEVK